MSRRPRRATIAVWRRGDDQHEQHPPNRRRRLEREPQRPVHQPEEQLMQQPPAPVQNNIQPAPPAQNIQPAPFVQAYNIQPPLQQNIEQLHQEVVQPQLQNQLREALDIQKLIGKSSTQLSTEISIEQLASSNIECSLLCILHESCRGASYNTVTRKCRKDNGSACVETEGDEDTNLMVREQHLGVFTTQHAQWKVYDGHCYGIFKKTLPFWIAQSQCKQDQAYLLKVDDDAEKFWILQVIKETNINWLWIGTSDAKNEGKWVWIVDDSKVTYNSWKPGEPTGNRFGDEDCAAANINMVWNDVSCDEKAFYICEKEL